MNTEHKAVEYVTANLAKEESMLLNNYKVTGKINWLNKKETTYL